MTSATIKPIDGQELEMLNAKIDQLVNDAIEDGYPDTRDIIDGYDNEKIYIRLELDEYGEHDDNIELDRKTLEELN